jgi:hypothetical protein
MWAKKLKSFSTKQVAAVRAEEEEEEEEEEEVCTRRVTRHLYAIFSFFPAFICSCCRRLLGRKKWRED